jgi:hypothetical protein
VEGSGGRLCLSGSKKGIAENQELQSDRESNRNDEWKGEREGYCHKVFTNVGRVAWERRKLLGCGVLVVVGVV